MKKDDVRFVLTGQGGSYGHAADLHSNQTCEVCSGPAPHGSTVCGPKCAEEQYERENQR
jgi:hypothetical protein